MSGEDADAERVVRVPQGRAHDAAADEREARLKELEHTLALLQGSTSWRLTAPLRRIRKAFLG